MNADSNDPAAFNDPLENYDPPQYDDPLEQALAEEPATAIHVSPVASVSPTTTVVDALAQMYDDDVGCLLVIEEDKLVGLLSVRDVLNNVAEDYATVRSSPVRDVMTQNPVFAYDTDASGAVLCVMAASGYRHVPILNSHDAPLGIASPQRVMDFLLTHLQDGP